VSKLGSRLAFVGLFLTGLACGNSKGNGDDGAAASASDDDDDTTVGGEPGAPGGRGGAGASGRGGSGGTSDAGAPAECSTRRCGGDVIGTWEIVESCVGSLTGVESCLGLEGDASGLKQTGTITYDTDSTYTSTTSATGSLTLTYPESCIGGIGCEELTNVLRDTAQAVEDLVCSAEGSACVCSLVYNQRTTTVSGSYTTNGGILLQTRGNATSRADYCVEGDRLTLSSGPAQSYVLTRR
jgi:hypothetical protein